MNIDSESQEPRCGGWSWRNIVISPTSSRERPSECKRLISIVNSRIGIVSVNFRQPMTFQPYWVSMLVTPILIRWLRIHAETARAKRKNGVVAFPATGVTTLCFISIVLATCLVIGAWSRGEGLLTVAIGIAWGLFILWLWPATIVLDDRGLTAKHIWRPTRTIAYPEIEYVSRMADRSAIVYGTGSVRQIRISEYHVGDAELESELKKRGVKHYGGPSSALAK